MAPKLSLYERMVRNPRDDWAIADIETLCDQEGLIIEPPTSGSHHKVRSSHLHGALMVPARRPIKPIYIKLLARLVREHREAASGEGVARD